MATEFVPDAVYEKQPPKYYRSLSALVHSYRKLVEAVLPPEQFAKLSGTCPCVECLWVMGEAEEVLRDGA